MLDANLAEVRRLEQAMGATDKGRLDQYLTSVREVEIRTQRANAWLDRPRPTIASADKAKLDAITPGGNSHLQSIQLCASRTQQLLPGSSFGADGQVEMLALNVVPDVCAVAGTLHDFWVEGQASANVNVTITLLRAPSTGGFPSTTAVTLTVPVGQVSASSAATLSVAAGDRISATSNALWNHHGLVFRARLRA